MRCSKRILCAVLVFVMLFLMSLTVLAKGEAEYEYYIENGTAVLTEYKGTSKKVVVPDVVDGYAVTRLEGTFCNNKKIKEVEISERISSVGEKTFYGCSNLRCVKLPLSLSHLGEYAFAYSGIKDIVLGPEIHYINSGCFLGCIELVMVESQAQAYDIAGGSCFVNADAFADSGVKVFFSDVDFLFADEKIPEAARYVRFSVAYYMYKSVLLAPAVLLMQVPDGFGIALSVLYIVFLLAVIVAVILIIARWLMTLVGANNVAYYKAYSSRAFSEIGKESGINTIIHYKKIEFKRDKIFKKLKAVLWIIVAFIFIGIYGYITFNTTFLSGSSYLKSFVVFFSMIGLIGAAAGILYAMRCFIKSHKKTSDKVRIRIRRKYSGEETDD